MLALIFVTTSLKHVLQGFFDLSRIFETKNECLFAEYEDLMGEPKDDLRRKKLGSQGQR